MGNSIQLSDLSEIKAPTFKLTQKGITAKRYFFLEDWSDIDELLSATVEQSSVAGTTIQRILGHTFPSKPYLVIDNIDIKGFNDNISQDADGVAECDSGAEITVGYTTVPYNREKSNAQGNTGDDGDLNPDIDVFMEHEIESRIEMLEHPKNAMQWELANDNGKQDVPEDIHAAVPIVLVEHQLVWRNVPKPPLKSWYKKLGRSNLTEFLDHAPETLLFHGMSARREILMDGSRKWDLTLRLLARIIDGIGQVDPNAAPFGTMDPCGWNFFLRPDPQAGHQQWQRIQSAQTLEFPVKTTDFHELLKLDEEQNNN